MMANSVALSALASQGPETVNIYWQNPAGLDPKQISSAFDAVQKLYGPIGFNVAPMPDNSVDPAHPYYTVVFANKPVDSFSGEPGGEALEQARRAYIYPSALDRFGSDKASALQLAIAHELGHVLGLGHAYGGVMSPTIQDGSIQHDLQPLSKGQIRSIEKSLVKLSTLANR